MATIRVHCRSCPTTTLLVAQVEAAGYTAELPRPPATAEDTPDTTSATATCSTTGGR